MAQIFVSIGSNIDRENSVAQALLLLKKSFGALHCSSVYETEAVGFEGPPFYNLVVEFSAAIPPVQVVTELKSIENSCGRERGQQKFVSRCVDLDLLLYDDVVLHEGVVHIPRDEIFNYAFVLEPLAEIAPRLRHPQTLQSYADLWQQFDKGNAKQQLLPGVLEKLLAN